MSLLALQGLPMQSQQENVYFSRDNSSNQLLICLVFTSKLLLKVTFLCVRLC